MIKTYDIDLDDELVESATRLFENLGTDIDSAIKIFLKQSLLRKGFPFEIAVPEEVESGKLKVESAAASAVEIPAQSESPVGEVTSENDDIHGGITEDEESAAATVTSVSAEIAARVAANEALVAEMRNEIGDKSVTPEFDENEDDGTHGDYEQETESGKRKVESEVVSGDDAPEVETPAQSESPAEEEDSEDEDETTPDNLFDAWDVGDEEEIGCK